MSARKNIARFAKIGADGSVLDPSATEWEAVLDNKTGLMWSVETKKVENYDKCADAIKKIKASGFEDWRMPTVDELFALADRTRASPAIDEDHFPGTPSDWFWSSTPYAASPGGYAWGVHFYGGGASWGSRSYYGFVRAVRGCSNCGNTRPAEPPCDVLAIVKRERDHYRDLISRGKGIWPNHGYVKDETWASWCDISRTLDGVVKEVERATPTKGASCMCVFEDCDLDALEGLPYCAGHNAQEELEERIKAVDRELSAIRRDRTATDDLDAKIDIIKCEREFERRRHRLFRELMDGAPSETKGAV